MGTLEEDYCPLHTGGFHFHVSESKRIDHGYYHGYLMPTQIAQVKRASETGIGPISRRAIAPCHHAMSGGTLTLDIS